jgi:hypothetical protein
MVKLVILVVLLAVAGRLWDDRCTLTPQKVEGSRDSIGVRMGRIVILRSESNDRVQGGRRR